MPKRKRLYKAILGPPGSGKTTAINNLVENNSSFGIKTATTGRAALIGSEGRTINSLLGYNNEAQLVEKVYKKTIYRRLKSISERYENIIIDEISMASAITINYLYLALSNFNKDGRNTYLGLILTGDFAQLPHISKRRPPTKAAFESKYWSEFEIAKLRKVKRQVNREFIEVLNHIRFGEAYKVIDWVENNIGFHEELNSKFEGTSIFSTNKDVNDYNRSKLNEIDSFSKDYPIKIKGKNPPLELIGGRIQKVLTLKEGCLVMTLVNNLNKGYANGSIGIVRRMKAKSVEVEFINGGHVVEIDYYRIDNRNIETNKSEGYISFIPLRLAFASTVHSIQGTTIKDKIQVKISNDTFLRRLSGGLYVIMSRVIDHNNIRIVGTKEDFIRSNYLDEKYLKWI